MSYRCQFCGEVSKPGQPLLRHIRYRPNKQIEAEIPVCRSCSAELSSGTAEQKLIQRLRFQGTYYPSRNRKVVAYDGLTMFLGDDATMFVKCGIKPLVGKTDKVKPQGVPFIAPKAVKVRFGSDLPTTLAEGKEV